MMLADGRTTYRNRCVDQPAAACDLPTGAAGLCRGDVCLSMDLDAGFDAASASPDASPPDAGLDAGPGPSPPRPLAPASASWSTVRRPTFRWELAVGSDGARVEICADRACGTVEHVLDVGGTAASAPMDLTPGVHFWRLFGRSGSTVGLTPGATWEVFVPRRSAPREASWHPVADFNGDGLGDLAVGAIYGGSGGRVHVYHASAGGFPATPSRSLEGPAGGCFGYSVSTPGDIDGDGFAELLATAPCAMRGFLYRGSISGVSEVPWTSFPSGNGATGGDINADGYSDLVVQGLAGESVSVYLGAPTGIDAVPTHVIAAPAGANARFAFEVSLGDLNGDGRGDLGCTDFGPDDGIVGHGYVYYSSATGALFPPTPSVTLVNPTSSRYYTGGGVAHVGDLNGDGYGDLAVGDYGAAGTGRVYVHFGGGSGVTAAASMTIASPRGSGFGTGVRFGGDTNADGLDDLLVANFLYPDTVDRRGEAYLFYGSPTGLPFSTSAAVTFISSDGANAYYARSLGGGADANGDGFVDIVVGSYRPDFSGAAHLYLGSGSGTSATAARVFTGPDGPGGYFAAALSL